MTEQAQDQQDDAQAAAEAADSTGEGTDQQNGAAAAQDGAQAGNGGDPLAEVRREASSYRRKLRAAESERDQLAERLTAARMREIERAASQPAEGFRPLQDARDLWRTDLTVADLLDDDGDVDAAKVRAAVAKLADEHPHWIVQATARGSADGGRGSAGPDEPSSPFGAALKRGR